MRPLLSLAAAGLLLASCSSSPPATPDPVPNPAPPIPEQPMPDPIPVPEPDPEPQIEIVPSETLPGPMREFRGIWAATVANIDWPSRSDLTTQQQQDELVAMMDRAQRLGFNAIVFQVRPVADALYASDLEPWSEYLTGREGQAPDPMYDPLELAIELAHERGLELHAWVNPYRAGHPAFRGPHASSHISNTRPDLVRRYGEYLWLDPGEPEAAEHSLAVITDIVRRYDVDGVHLDDYFYPYPIQRNGRDVSFPDADSYRRAQDAGETLGRDDWRRQNVDMFIERLYTMVKAEKPHVKVGISPFGIWRPGHPEGITGFDQYARLYADARKWQQEGWLDYLAPQLYWSIDSRGQSFPKLLNWWGEQNTAGRHLWPGLYDSRMLPDVGGYELEEIPNQVELVRENEVATGTIHFSEKALRSENGPLGELLGQRLYADRALVPASPWLVDAPPPAPDLLVVPTASGRSLMLIPGTDDAAGPHLWVVRTQTEGTWTWELAAGETSNVELAEDVEVVAVSVIDRTGNEGPASVLSLEPESASGR
ncbi:MAG: family 10 glycosylhydrolase [Bacteroidota bacterium]